MDEVERKALIETVRLEAEFNANYDGTAFKLLHRIGRCIETDGQRIEAQAAEIARLRDVPNHIWAEARDTEWDLGFNYAVKMVRAALAQETQP